MKCLPEARLEVISGKYMLNKHYTSRPLDDPVFLKSQTILLMNVPKKYYNTEYGLDLLQFAGTEKMNMYDILYILNKVGIVDIVIFEKSCSGLQTEDGSRIQNPAFMKKFIHHIYKKKYGGSIRKRKHNHKRKTYKHKRITG